MKTETYVDADSGESTTFTRFDVGDFVYAPRDGDLLAGTIVRVDERKCCVEFSDDERRFYPHSALKPALRVQAPTEPIPRGAHTDQCPATWRENLLILGLVVSTASACVLGLVLWAKGCG